MPSQDHLVGMYEIMATIKQTDERFRTMISSGQIQCLYYSPRGQEVVASAVGVQLRSDDYVVTTYRGLHDQIAKGVSLRELWAEYLGRSSGSCKGKGGPMHITAPKAGLMVTTGIVGSGIPIANGLALASQLRGTDQVTVVNFGDGASNIGAFHEALNLASVWGLPVVFLCQNNQYAEHTRFAAGTAAARVSDRAIGYSMPGVTVDGNDPLAMHRAAADAIQRARSGEGPTLVEALTYRFHGHIFGDSMGYMPAEERAAAMEADPVPRYREWLVAEGQADAQTLDGIDQRVTDSLDDAVDFALASPAPDTDELFTDVYAADGDPAALAGVQS